MTSVKVHKMSLVKVKNSGPYQACALYHLEGAASASDQQLSITTTLKYAPTFATPYQSALLLRSSRPYDIDVQALKRLNEFAYCCILRQVTDRRGYPGLTAAR